MQLAIIIINYRTFSLTADCLYSLARERELDEDFTIVLVDNASGDGSAQLLEQLIAENQWAGWITLLQENKNLGFAKGNNAGLGFAFAQYPDLEFVLFLNSDTIVHSGCLRKCFERMSACPDIGILSCNILNSDGSVQNVCRKMPSPLRESVRALGLAYAFPKIFGWGDLEDFGWDRTSISRDVDWVGGAFMYTRASMLLKSGGMDEDFFFYGEDIEFCFRARKNGWRVFFDPAGETTHLGGASSDPSRLQDRRRNVLRWKARFMVQRKCYGRLAENWVTLMYLSGISLRKYWLLFRHGKDLPRYQDAANALEEISAARKKSSQ